MGEQQRGQPHAAQQLQAGEPSQPQNAREPSPSHWGFAAHAAMAIIVIVLLALTFSTLELFFSGDESLSAREAAMANVGGSNFPALLVE
jgi:hypothetical protein